MKPDHELLEWLAEERAAEWGVTMLRVQRAIAADREAARAPEDRRRAALNARNRRYRRNLRRQVEAARLVQRLTRDGIL